MRDRVITTVEVANQVFRQIRIEHDAVKTATYVAVPGTDMARWLLPVARPEIGRVLASWTPYRMSSRLAWTAVRASGQLGRITEFPGAATLEVEEACGADWSLLGWKGCEPPVPVIYLGTPGPRRKAVVHLVEQHSGNCQAVVKIPLTEEAKAAVMYEAEVLEALAREHFDFSPRLLYVDWTRAITTQTFVAGRPGTRKLKPEFRRLLQSLLLPGETTTLARHAEEWSREIGRLNWDSADRITATGAIDRLLDDSALPACWEHGDFTPWNIRRLPESDCVLLDWEDAQRQALPLQDVYHFLNMQDWLFGGRPRLHAAEVREEANAMGLQPTQCRRLEIAYLVHTYVKCVGRQNFERARFVSSTLALATRETA